MLDPAASADTQANSCGILGAGVGSALDVFDAGAWIVMAAVIGIGLLLTADTLVLRVPKLIVKAIRKTGQALPAALAVLKPRTATPTAEAPRGKTPAAAVKAKPEPAERDKAADNAPDEKNDKREKKSPVPVASPAPASLVPAAVAAVNEPTVTNDQASGTYIAGGTPPPRLAVPPAIVAKPMTPKPPDKASEKSDKGSDKSTDKSADRAVQLTLPLTTLLAEPTGGYLASQEAQADQKRAILQQTLNDFQVAAQVVGHMTGPVITLYELSLAPGVKVSQVASLSTDIARALAVPGVRIVSPLPNKDTVGVEVPNLQKEVVRIRELMDMRPDAEKKMFLPLYLGKDAGGGAIVSDLAKMPHMLIAGTTGSGKSVCINTIIMSLLLTRQPDEVRFILVDPKMVEMAAFENIRHLLCPVVNDMKRAEEILEWAATKMDERYELLKDAMVKNIAEYNKLSPEEMYKRLGIEDEEEKNAIQTRLPYYVIIIDELADLIMTNKDVEGHIIRIAQKARAVGIHLILATQRPSVNVVTGLIKSNMPSRISFKVASRQESRIVLDANGAEVLLGQGDMLFLQPGMGPLGLMRAQGTYVDDSEIHAIVASIRSQGEPAYNSELMKIGSASFEDGDGERDELFDKAVEIVLASQRGSVSLLQRRLAIGYSRSSRIIDQMAQAGLLGDYKGSQARECLMTLEDWRIFKASVAADQSGESSADGEPTSA
jgi:S-DNA-T family DNA segregation ATPase FtsK/SpoIIIE